MAVDGEYAAPRTRPVGLLGDAIDDPAAAAAPEDQRIGALQHFDALEIVQPAIILDVVAQPVDEEIGGAVLAAQDDRVAMPFARGDARPRYRAHDIGDRAHALVVDALLGDDADRLRDVLERAVGLGRRADAGVALTDDDNWGGCLAGNGIVCG